MTLAYGSVRAGLDGKKCTTPPNAATQPPHIAGPSDCLITKMKSLRIEYLKFFVYKYPKK
jgi:hypothetical protein